LKRGFFLPIAVEGQYDTYINTMSVKYGLLLSYFLTLMLLLVSDISSSDFFVYQLSTLFLVHMGINIHFIFWFENRFGIEKLILGISKREALLSLAKSIFSLIIICFISLIVFSLFEKEKPPVNLILAILFPYFFANVFHGGLNEGIKSILKLIKFRENKTHD
jgi:hypothetical protein